MFFPAKDKDFPEVPKCAESCERPLSHVLSLVVLDRALK